MPELDLTKNIEKQFAQIDQWILRLAENDTLEIIDSITLRDVLKSCSANFEVGEHERRSLGKYTNAGKAVGMRTIWGNRYDDFREWTKGYIETYEKGKGKSLPELKPSGIKYSGMVQFFGEVTSYAAGEIDFETLKNYLEARAQNGRLWEEGKKEERVRIKIPTSDKPILLSSFPPGFPLVAWEKIKSWRVKENNTP